MSLSLLGWPFKSSQASRTSPLAITPRAAAAPAAVLLVMSEYAGTNIECSLTRISRIQWRSVQRINCITNITVGSKRFNTLWHSSAYTLNGLQLMENCKAGM